MCLGAFGGMTAYSVIMGDTVTVVLTEWSGATGWWGEVVSNRVYVVVACNVLFTLPLGMLRSMDKVQSRLVSKQPEGKLLGPLLPFATVRPSCHCLPSNN